MADSVKIRITGDDSAYRKTLGGLGSVTKSVVKGFTVASAAINAAWGAIGAVGIKYNSEIEALQTSFEVMTGSAQKAAEITERLRKIGAETPFDLKGLASTTKLLMNYGFEADRAVAEMMMLGDIAQGNAEAMTSIATGYAQMSSLGKVNLQDIKQMINGGFNPLQEISERTGESMEKLYARISKGTMAVDEITESMRHATSEGGKYYQSMEKQAQTFQGRLETLKEDATAFTGQIMTSVADSLRDSVIPMASDMLAEFSEAFSTGGFDGLIDAITAKIPELLDKAIDMLKQGISGLAKWLPGAVKQIATVIPGALRAILDVSPQIVQSLFEVAASLVSDLITMLPELIPTILEGVGGMLRSMTIGIGKLIEGVFDGLDNMMIDIGLKRASVGKAINRMFGDYDQQSVREMKETWHTTITTGITVDDYQAKIDAAISEVHTALKNIPDIKDTDRAEIELAVANGTGIPILQATLEGLEVDPKVAEGVVTTIATAMDTINGAIMDLGLSDDATTQIKELLASGASASEIEAALISFGVNPLAAATASLTLRMAMSSVNTALEGLGLSEEAVTQINALVTASASAAEIEAALVSFGVPDEVAKTAAESLANEMGRINTAINGLGLDDGATTAITKLVEEGASSDEIAEALVSFGVDEDVAKAAAESITNGMAMINSAIGEIGITPGTKRDLLLGVLGDRASIIAMLTMLDVPQDVIDTIAGNYDEISGTLTGKLTAAINNAYAALTDGEADTPKVMAEIKAEIERAYTTAVDEINAWIAEEIAKLDPTSSDYKEKVAAIERTGKESIDEVTGYEAAMWKIIAGLAGESKEKVSAAWGQITELLDKAKEVVKEYEDLESRINRQRDTDIQLTEQGSVRASNKEVGVRAFAEVAQRNDAEKAKIKKYKDEQQAALAELFEKTGDQTAYDAGIAALEVELEQMNAKRMEQYHVAMSKLLSGLLVSLEQTDPEIAAALKKLLDPEGTMSEIQTAMDAWSAGELDASHMTDSVVDAINEATGFDWTAEDYLKLNNEDLGIKLQGALDAAVAGAEETLNADDIDLGFVKELLITALQEGAFNDFSADGINTTDLAAAMKTVGIVAGASIPEGISENKDAIMTAAEEAAGAGTEAADQNDEFKTSGVNSGQGWITGFNTKVDGMVTAAENAAKEITRRFRAALGISSPSKVFMQLGGFTGRGFEVGYTESMRHAIKTARSLAGSLVGAANMPARFAMPNIAEAVVDMMAATDSQATPVYLDSKQIASIQRNNNNVAITRHSRRVLMGYGGR